MRTPWSVCALPLPHMPGDPWVSILERDVGSSSVIRASSVAFAMWFPHHGRADQSAECSFAAGVASIPQLIAQRAHIWRSDGATWFDPKDVAPEFAEAVVAQQK